MIDAAFDAHEAIEVNPVGTGSAVFPTNAVFPSCSKSGAFDCSQQVYAIRGNAQLENLLHGIRIQKMRTAEFSKRVIGTFDIGWTGINPYVHILCVAWFCMIDESKATNNQVSDAVFPEHMEQVFKILNGLHRC